MGKPILYGVVMSPPVRAVLLTANAIGLEFEFKKVNLLAGENKSEEFLKKNPQHTVPTLEDDGKIIWDSHAIATYLIGKYAKDDSLYPKDLYKRALVDQRLHFDSGKLFVQMQGICKNIIFKDNPIIPAETITAVHEAYEFMEKFLENDSYLVGDSMTVADLCCVATIASLKEVVEIDAKKFSKLQAWLHRMSQLPYYEDVNAKGARDHGTIMKNKINALLRKNKEKEV